MKRSSKIYLEGTIKEWNKRLEKTISNNEVLWLKLLLGTYKTYIKSGSIPLKLNSHRAKYHLKLSSTGSGYVFINGQKASSDIITDSYGYLYIRDTSISNVDVNAITYYGYRDLNDSDFICYFGFDSNTYYTNISELASTVIYENETTAYTDTFSILKCYTGPILYTVGTDFEFGINEVNIETLEFSTDANGEVPYITSLELPEGMTILESNTIDSFPNLTTVTLPSTITSIKANAFFNCENLTKIIYNGDFSNLTQIEDYCFGEGGGKQIALLSNNHTLNVIIKPLTIVNTFNIKLETSSLLIATLEDIYTNAEIEEAIKALKKIYSKIEINGVEIDFNSLSIYYSSWWTLVYYRDSILSPGTYTVTYYLRDGKGSNVLFKWVPMETSVINADLEYLNDYCYDRCLHMKSVSLPGTLKELQYTFSDCKSLTEITIPDSVTSVNHYATCRGCYFLPENVSYSEGAYALGATMVDLQTEEGLSIIDNVVVNCAILADLVVIPDTVTTIGVEAFLECECSSITIPDSVTTIVSGAFRLCNCPVYDFGNTRTTVPTLGSYTAFALTSAFSSYSIRKIYVPDALYDEWRAASNWKSGNYNLYQAITKYSEKPS